MASTEYQLSSGNSTHGKIKITPPLTLAKAIRTALHNNPDIMAGRWQQETARLNTLDSSSGHLPQMELNLHYRHHWDQARLAPPNRAGEITYFSHDIFGGDFALKIPLFSGGKVVNSVKAGKLLEKAANCNFKRTKRELIYNIKNTFFAIAGQKQHIKSIKKSIAAMQNHLETTKALIIAKKAAPIDLQNIEVRIAELQHELATQKGELQISRSFLANLMGISGIPPETELVQGTLKVEKIKLERDKLIKKAIKQREDLVALSHKIEAQKYFIAKEKGDYLPVISAGMTYGARLSSQSDYDDLGYAGLEISFPMFNWFSISNRIRKQQAKLKILEQEKRKLVLKINQQINLALIKIKTALTQIKLTAKTTKQAAESLRISKEKAALSRGTTNEVLDAQASLFAAKTRHLKALFKFHSALAFLDFSSGVIHE
ncbi:MAG: TolC family protein [Myxococcota bacterium]